MCYPLKIKTIIIIIIIIIKADFRLPFVANGNRKPFLAIFDPHSSIVKGIYLSKALTFINFFLYKQKSFFYHIIYTSHLDHFTPQLKAFEQSTACLSVFLKSLPGLTPFTIL